MSTRHGYQLLICAECGYDLHGLELPRACPECGRVADPQRDHEAALEWYGSWRGLFFRRPPPMVTRHLSDPRCRAVAVRRVWRLGVLPWVASTVAVLGLLSIVVERDLEIWWETPSEPGRRFSAYTDTERDRPLQLPIKLRGLSWFPPANSTQHTKLRAARLRWAWPEPEPLEIGIIAIPTLNLLGIPFLWVTMRVAHRRRDGPGNEAARPPPVLPLVGLLAPWHCLCAIILIHLGGLSALVLVWGMDIFLPLFLPIVWLAYLIPGAVLTVRALRGMRPRRRNYPAVALIAACVAWLGLHIGVWIAIMTLAGKLFS